MIKIRYYQGKVVRRMPVKIVGDRDAPVTAPQDWGTSLEPSDDAINLSESLVPKDTGTAEKS